MYQSAYNFGIDVLRLAIWLAILSAIFVPLERLWPVKKADIFRHDIWKDVGYYFINSLIAGLVLGAPLALIANVAHTILPADYYDWLASMPFWARSLIALLIAETGFYLGHRLSHEWPFLWEFHSVHHSAEHMDFLVNTRAHPVDIVFVRMCGFTPLYMLGFASTNDASGSMTPLIIGIIGVIWGFFVHANVKWRLGFFERILATPMFHHWHHTLEGPTNRNYAAMLPILDILFGTHHSSQEWPSKYGVQDETSYI